MAVREYRDTQVAKVYRDIQVAKVYREQQVLTESTVS
jgi:hypothetical protein